MRPCPAEPDQWQSTGQDIIYKINNLPDVPLVDDGNQHKTHGVVLDASRPGHTHLRKYNPHPYLLINIPGLDPTNIIAI